MDEFDIWHKFIPSDKEEETVLCWKANGVPNPVPESISLTAIDAYVTCEPCLVAMRGE